MIATVNFAVKMAASHHSTEEKGIRKLFANSSFGVKIYCSYDKCNRISLFSAELFWSCLKYISVLQIWKKLLKCDSCNTWNAEYAAYQYHLCNWYLWIPVDNNAKMWGWVIFILFSLLTSVNVRRRLGLYYILLWSLLWKWSIRIFISIRRDWQG